MNRKKFKLNEQDFNLIKQLKEMGHDKERVAEITGWSTATIRNVFIEPNFEKYKEVTELYRLKRIEQRKEPKTLFDIDETGKAEIEGVIAGVDFAVVDNQIDQLNAKLDTVLQIIREINDSLEKNNRKRGIWS